MALGGSTTNVKAVITAEDRASSVLKSFGTHVNTLGGAVEKGLKIAAVGLTAATGAVTAFGVSSLKAFTESQDLIAQTNAVLKSTNGIAGVTADQVTKLATALEKQTKFSDEDVRSVENMLLTFTALNKKIFPQATETVLNMAQALGEDTKSASIQLGKALQDPILGVTALRRVGVNFNSAQQEVIKNLVNTGHVAKAQKLILKELQTEFGGSAKAARNTFSGALVELKNQLNNVQESVGGLISNALTPLINKATKAVLSIDWTKVINTTIGALKDFGREIIVVAKRIYEIYQAVYNYLEPKLAALFHTIANDLIPALTKFWKNVIQPLIPIIGTIFVAALGFAIDAFNLLLKVVTPVMNFLSDHTWIIWGLVTAFGALKVAMLLGAAFDAIKVGITTISLVSLPSLQASIAATSASWAAAFPVAAIIAAIASVGIAITKVIGYFHALNDAKKSADDAAKSAEHLNDVLTKSEKLGRNSLQQIYNVQKSTGVSNDSNRVYKSTKGGQTVYTVGFASGTNYAPGGLASINERGGEIVDLPRGSRVYPADKSKQMMKNDNRSDAGTVNIVVNVGLYAGSEQEKRKVATELFKSLQQVASAKSTSVAKMMGVA